MLAIPSIADLPFSSLLPRQWNAMCAGAVNKTGDEWMFHDDRLHCWEDGTSNLYEREVYRRLYDLLKRK